MDPELKIGRVFIRIRAPPKLKGSAEPKPKGWFLFRSVSTLPKVRGMIKIDSPCKIYDEPENESSNL